MRHATLLLVALMTAPSFAWSDGPTSPASQEIRGPLLPDVAEESRPIVRLASAVEPTAPRPVNAGVQPTEAQVRLAQKIAQLELLQADVDALREATGTPRQFVIHIEMLEVNNTKMRELGFDFAKFTPNGVIPASFEIQTLGDSSDAAQMIAALKQNSLARPLSNPTIVVTSGKPASFLIGGQLPMPAAPGSDAAVTYKDFGTSVDVRAESLGQNRVRLELSPKFSEIDETHSIEIEGQHMPSLRVRQFSTGCEMNVGQTVAFGGLTQERVESVKHVDGRVEERTIEIATWCVVRVEPAEPMDPHKK